jgi:hypothetical protein
VQTSIATGTAPLAPASVVGYHGCSRETAAHLLAGEPFTPSNNRYDWLGLGAYFWEYAPFRAREWAERTFADQGVVVQATIHLGRCLNLLDREHMQDLANVYKGVMEAPGATSPRLLRNTDAGAHFLDRFVIDTYCDLAGDRSSSFQTVRAGFPEGEPVYPGSKILTRTHMQIAVRDLSCITEVALVEF